MLDAALMNIINSRMLWLAKNRKSDSNKIKYYRRFVISYNK